LTQLSSAQDETRYASEAARVAQLQYEHGLITLVDVQQRQQNALSAQVDLYNARVAYVNALVKLRVALGLETPEQAVADL
ncbi:MAG TPA: TolC family protein, partial [Candidatus Baltobacteraceae bacterium]|nr:TolC family protein [Candidatus Baltobacteraceae bacterium]